MRVLGWGWRIRGARVWGVKVKIGDGVEGYICAGVRLRVEDWRVGIF